LRQNIIGYIIIRLIFIYADFNDMTPR